MRTRSSAIGTAAAVLAVGLLLAAGGVRLLATHGVSMEPTLTEGDLVVLAPAASYGIGDVAAYRSPLLDGGIVLHRIVAEDADGFRLAGDGNDWLDPETVAAAQLMGRMRMRVPWVGSVARALRGRQPIGPALAAAALLLGPALLATRADRRRKRSRPMHRPPTATAPSSRRHERVLAGLALVALLLVAIGGLAWTRAPTTTGSLTLTHESSFSYRAAADDRRVYEAGDVRTGDPVFLRLVRDLRVGFAYELAGDLDPGVTGTLVLDAVVSDGSGWTRRLELGGPVALVGGAARVEAPLDTRALLADVAEVQALTGAGSGAATVTLTPRVDLRGALDGRPIEQRFAPELAMELTETRLRPTEGGTSLAVAEAVAVEVPGAAPSVLSAFGRSIEVGTARLLPLVGAPLLLLGLGGLVVTRRRTARLDGDARLARRYGALLVDAAAITAPEGQLTIDVAEPLALCALAEQHERTVAHERVGGAHRYVLDLDGVLYRAAGGDRSPRLRPAPAAAAADGPGAPRAAGPAAPPAAARVAVRAWSS
jgi:hypothetical protein